MRLLFFGTPTFSVPFLEALCHAPDMEVVGVVTQPDKPVGRTHCLTPSPVKIAAQQFSIPVFQFNRLKKSEVASQLALCHADLFVVVAYGQIIPEALLQLPSFGTVNVHPSLLPRYRGPSPRQSVLANREKESGVSIMLLDAQMDHGPLLAQQSFPLDENETMQSLEKKIQSIAIPLLLQSIRGYLAGDIIAIPQDHTRATFSPMLTREMGLIDWKKDAAESIDARFRAYHPWPGLFFIWHRRGEPIHIKILSQKMTDEKLTPGSVQNKEGRLLIGTTTTAMEILELQPQNKSKMRALDFLNGYPDFLTSSL